MELTKRPFPVSSTVSQYSEQKAKVKLFSPFIRFFGRPPEHSTSNDLGPNRQHRFAPRSTFYLKSLVKVQNRKPESIIATGSVKTQASAKFLTVDI